MKNFFLVLLTTLFVSAMPLQAAYATADDGQTKEACSVSYKDALSDESREQLKLQNGTVVELTGAQAKAFQSRVEALIHVPAPFSSDQIIIVNPDGDQNTLVNVGFFVDNCLKALLHFPQPVVDTLLSPLEKKPGERVD